MKYFLFFLSVVNFFCCKLKADEGMWLLPLLNDNMDSMKAKGFQLTAEDIYNINNSCIKDAIVIFGGGCTGEIISEEGLLLTNHHCGFDAIQFHSSVEHNYLEKGFWAKTKEDELPAPDLSVSFLIRIEDVTDKVLQDVTGDMDESERFALIDEICSEIEEGTGNENEHYQASVKSFYDNNRYYLMVYKKYNDVRLVGAPPSSIGKFGADTDNWMWPRHTGDFSLFRVYTDKDGNPADYAEDNIPLKPGYVLPVSLNGYKKGDFTFIMGFPGSTTRYMTSYELKELMEVINPNRIKIRGIRQNILLEDMLQDEKVEIQYATKYSRSSNYWKYSIGQNKGLENLDIKEKKKDYEKDFKEWVAMDPSKKEKYGDALSLIESALNARMQYTHASQYISECFWRSCEAVYFSNSSYSIYQALKNGKNNLDEMVEDLKEEAQEFYKNYNPETDKKVTKAMIKLYADDISGKFHPAFYQYIGNREKDIDKFVDKLFRKSIFTDPEKFYKFLEKPGLSALDNDVAIKMAADMSEKSKEIYDSLSMYKDIFSTGRRLYMAGLTEMEKERSLYPDANFTMRLTYGSVEDYYPADAVYYNYYTTLSGVMEKEDPDDWEFVVSEKLKKLYRAKDYGHYGEGDVMKACFLSNNDITGGNSGSPVLNGKGELIGLAFDGNWEAMSGDIIFEPALQRCINVDIRYVLFIIDKFAGATNLIEEMKIVE